MKKLRKLTDDDPIPMGTFKHLGKQMRVGKKHEDFEFVKNNLIVNRSVHRLVENK